jgi:hypothetical protein
MVIGWPSEPAESSVNAPESSAWTRIESTQKQPRLPCLLVPQPAHSVLAGDLANALLPEYFGELPPTIVQAIAMHDTGWAMLDAAQIQQLRGDNRRSGHKAATPKSFVSASVADSIQAWTASIDFAQGISADAGMVVSRHFLLLASSRAAEFSRFLKMEEKRYAAPSDKRSVSAKDLQRYIDVLGFCDLLSLFLLTGLSGPQSFPLAHPSSPAAAGARRVLLESEGSLLRFSPQIFPSGFHAEIEGLKHPLKDKDSRSARLQWEVA